MQLLALVLCALALCIPANPTKKSPPNSSALDMLDLSNWMQNFWFLVQDKSIQQVIYPGAVLNTTTANVLENLENGCRYLVLARPQQHMNKIIQFLKDHPQEIVVISSTDRPSLRPTRHAAVEIDAVRDLTFRDLIQKDQRIVWDNKHSLQVKFGKDDALATLLEQVQTSTLYKELYENDSMSQFAENLNSNGAWMTQHAAKLGGKKVFQLAIPGTHHSGFLSVSFWNRIPGIWSICQRMSINDQLNIGIRWFDLRIAEKDNEMIFAHTIPSTNKLEPALQDLRNFVDRNRGELIILDINNDYGYKSNTDRARANLKARLNQFFENMLVTRQEFDSNNFQDLIANNKRVVITGDWRIHDIPSVGSWGITQSGNWGTVVNNGIDWINKQGLEAIQQGRMAVVSAAVTPTVGKDVSPPTSVADRLNQLLSSRLQTVTVPFNVISHDLANAELSQTIINHNLK
jgi:hypothetical protein